MKNKLATVAGVALAACSVALALASGSARASMTCKVSGDCASGFCVDGVCCDLACDGKCQACDVTNAAGTCTTVTGTPHGERSCGGTGPCDGTCDGNSATTCAFPPAGTSCSQQVCAGSSLFPSGACDDAGHCMPRPMLTCPNGCDGDDCLGGNPVPDDGGIVAPPPPDLAPAPPSPDFAYVYIPDDLSLPPDLAIGKRSTTRGAGCGCTIGERGGSDTRSGSSPLPSLGFLVAALGFGRIVRRRTKRARG